MRRRATWYEDLFSLDYFVPDRHQLTHWGRATHICVGKLNIIGSDNGLSPGRRQAIIWTIAGILLIGPMETNFIGIETFSFKKMHLKMSFGKWRPFCLGLNVLHGPWFEKKTDKVNVLPCNMMTRHPMISLGIMSVSLLTEHLRIGFSPLNQLVKLHFSIALVGF